MTSGIHPELTGKENIYLYGAVMGMGRQTIRHQFDEIVEFAGLTDAVNRQVKFYSMGMQMRLGFSIAAFLEPDVLLVDEVLSVGDANFQQKCLKRIGEIVRAGTTLLYVSHDLASVEASCEKAVWLADAVVQASGPTRDVVAKYRAAVEQNAALTTSTEGVVEVLKCRDRGGRRRPGAVGVRPRRPADAQLARAPRGQLLHRGVPGQRLPHVHRPLQRLVPGGGLRGQRAGSATSRWPRAATRSGRPCRAMPAARASHCCRGGR